MVTFTAPLLASGSSATGVAVPEDVWHSLTPARRAAVTVTINGHSYRSTIGWYRGAFMLPVSAENREAAGVAAGETLELTIELDTEPRIVEVPADLAEVLDATTMAAWQALSPSAQKAMATSITGAKTDETRARRLSTAIEQLSA